MKSNILPIILFLVLTLVLSVLNPLLLVFAILGLAVGYLLSRIVGERLVGKEGGQAKHAMVNTEAKTESGEAKAVERPDDAEVEQVTENISGFTLVELLVVVAIIAILAAIIFPMFAKTREKAYQSQCSNHLRQLGVALQTYIQDNGERLPSHENWIAATGIKKVDNEILHCPSDLRNATEAGSDMNQELDIIVSYDMNP